MALLAALLVGACANTGNVASDVGHQQQLGRVAVVAPQELPELRFEGFARGKAQGAAIGGGGSFAACLGSAGGGGCSGAVCGAALILLVGICGVAGLVGGVAGAATAPSADQVAASEATLATAVEARTIQESLRREVVDAALAAGIVLVDLPAAETSAVAATRDYRALAAHGVDTVLETTLTHAGTAGMGINSPAAAYMEVRVRLVDVASQQERHVASYRYEGRRRKLAAWSADQGKALSEELAQGYRRLGAHIASSTLELYPLPDRDPHSAGGALSWAFGLAPIEPPTCGVLTGDRLLGARFEWFAVDSLRPRLRWQAFPRRSDLAANPAEMGRVRNIRYELVVAREEEMVPGEIVYRRTGLTLPEHALESPLRPNARYFWTVRARFELDGRSRVTEWGATLAEGFGRVTAPSKYSYRFRTPAAD